MMKITVNPTGIPGVVHQNIRDIHINKNNNNKSSVSVRSLLMKTLVDAPIK